MEYRKSPLKWAGGKGKVLPMLLPMLEKYKKDVFVEPFVGAANVSLNFDAKEYIWCDTNLDLLIHHKAVVHHTHSFVQECEKLFMEGFSIYSKIKERFNKEKGMLETEEYGAMFQYLNKHCFNGLCRYNSKGEFNVPIGTTTKPRSVPHGQVLCMAQRHNKNTRMRCMPFENTFKLVEKRDNCLIYCDPPYLPLNSSFKYDKNGFGMDEQVSLRDWAKKSRHTTILSNHWTPEAEELYKDASDIIVFDVQRTISCKGEDRKKVQECIVIYEK